MELKVGQVWAYRENGYSPYSKYLKITKMYEKPYAAFDCDHYDSERGHSCFKVEARHFLENAHWELLNAEKVCTLLERYIVTLESCKDLRARCDNAQEAAAKEHEMRQRAEKAVSKIDKKLRETEKELEHVKNKNKVPGGRGVKIGEIYLHKDVEIGCDHILEIKNVRNATNEADVKVIDLICGDARSDIVKINHIGNHCGYCKVDAQKLFELMSNSAVEIRALKDALADRDATIANLSGQVDKSSVVVCLENGSTAIVEGGVRWECVYEEIRIYDAYNNRLGTFAREKTSGIFSKTS